MAFGNFSHAWQSPRRGPAPEPNTSANVCNPCWRSPCLSPPAPFVYPRGSLRNQTPVFDRNPAQTLLKRVGIDAAVVPGPRRRAAPHRLGRPLLDPWGCGRWRGRHSASGQRAGCRTLKTEPGAQSTTRGRVTEHRWNLIMARRHRLVRDQFPGCGRCWIRTNLAAFWLGAILPKPPLTRQITAQHYSLLLASFQRVTACRRPGS